MSQSFDREAARAWMRGAVELARDARTGEVLAEELAERCALAFGVAGEGGPLEDADHWIYSLARQIAEKARPRGTLLLVRIRTHGKHARTFWSASDGGKPISYAPHVTEREVVARFQAETGRTYERVVKVRRHHDVRDVEAIVRRTFKR